MVTLSNQQLSQVNNILHTLLEATEHFHQLIKSREIKQGIYIFSSVVEGFDAISNMISLHNEDLANKKKKMETYLLQISRLREDGKLTKVSEVLQFSLLP
ncbi:hypothetical protein FRY77_30505, partial [Halomonas sp. MG34]|nr:hypothetical protein [Halomonas sp. MG34]